MVIQNNLMALYSYRQSAINNQQLQASLLKLASGRRINSAADDAAGLAISEQMRAQQTGYERAMMNTQDASSLVRTADGALSTVHDMLNRLTDLAGRASSGILSADQRGSLEKEMTSILSEIDRISRSTNFNGIKLLDGSQDSGAYSATVSGVKVSQSAATTGQYDFASFQAVQGLTAGDTVEFTLGTNAGYSSTMKFTVGNDLQSLIAADGTSYRITSQASGSTVDVQGSDIASALESELQKSSANSDFIISSDGNGLSLQNRQSGSSATRVTGLSYSVNGATYNVVDGTGTAGKDSVSTISKNSLTVFDGANESQATFSVNGQKFTLVSDDSLIAKITDKSTHIISVSSGTGAGLTESDMTRIAAAVNYQTGMAFESSADGMTVKGPKGGDALTFQIGTTGDSYNQLNVSIANMSSRGLGLSGISFSSVESSQNALSRIRSAIAQVSTTRAGLGAAENRLDYTYKSLSVANENITAAESRIRDTDMAKEYMNYMRKNLLNQASMAMMAQANNQTQNVLTLLR